MAVWMDPDLRACLFFFCNLLWSRCTIFAMLSMHSLGLGCVADFSFGQAAKGHFEGKDLIITSACGHLLQHKDTLHSGVGRCSNDELAASLQELENHFAVREHRSGHVSESESAVNSGFDILLICVARIGPLNLQEGLQCLPFLGERNRPPLPAAHHRKQWSTSDLQVLEAVSYTHLTLPTKLEV